FSSCWVVRWGLSFCLARRAAPPSPPPPHHPHPPLPSRPGWGGGGSRPPPPRPPVPPAAPTRTRPRRRRPSAVAAPRITVPRPPNVNTQTGPVTLTSAQLVTPNILFPGLDFVSRVEFARELQQGFAYNEIAGRFGPLYRLDRHTIAASLNFVRYFDAVLNGVDLTQLLQQGGPTNLVGCDKACTLTYPELRYTYDSRDNVLEP